MNQQLLEMLQGAGAPVAPPTIDERIAETRRMRDGLNKFEYGRAYAENAQAFGMHTIAQLVELGALEIAVGKIHLTAIGKHEVHRLNHVLKELEAQAALQQAEDEEIARAVAEREAELNAPHPDFADSDGQDLAGAGPVDDGGIGQGEEPPASTYEGAVVEPGQPEGTVEYGDEDPETEGLPAPEPVEDPEG